MSISRRFIFPTAFVTIIATFCFVNCQSLASDLETDNPLELNSCFALRGVNDVIVQGNYAYCSMTAGMQVLDLSSIQNPRVVSQVPLLYGTCGKMVRKGINFYLARSGVGISNVERDNEQNLRHVGDIEIPEEVLDLTISGSRLLVLSLNKIYIIDVSLANEPLVIGQMADGNWGRAIAASSTHVYIARLDGMVDVVDIQSPATPKVVGLISESSTALDLIAIGDTVYVAAGDQSLRIYDCANSSLPILLWSGRQRVSKLCDYVSNGRLFAAGDVPQFLIIDIRNPRSPSVVGSMGGVTLDRSFFPSGNLVFFAAGPRGIQVIDVTSPGSLKWLVQETTRDHPRSVVSRAGMIYAAAGLDGILVYSGTDILRGRPTSTWNDQECSYCSAVKCIGNNSRLYALFVNGSDSNRPGLRVFEFFGTQLRLLADHSANWGGWALAEVGRDTIVTTSPSGQLVLVDFRNEDSPSIVTTLGNFGTVQIKDVTVVGDRVYVAAGIDGIFVFDISNRTSPQQLLWYSGVPVECRWVDGPGVPPEYWCYGGAQSLSISNGFVAVGNNEVKGFAVVDLRDLDNPNLAYSGPGPAWSGLSYASGLAFLQESGVLEIYGAPLPSEADLITMIEFPGRISATTELGDELAITSSAGVFLFDLDITTDVVDYQPTIVPNSSEIEQNYPNPFNLSTRLEFTTARAGHVSIQIFDVLGRAVKTLIDEDFEIGKYGVTWDGSDNFGRAASSGVYFYRMRTADFVTSRKMLLLK